MVKCTVLWGNSPSIVWISVSVAEHIFLWANTSSIEETYLPVGLLIFMWVNFTFLWRNCFSVGSSNLPVWKKSSSSVETKYSCSENSTLCWGNWIFLWGNTHSLLGNTFFHEKPFTLYWTHLSVRKLHVPVRKACFSVRNAPSCRTSTLSFKGTLGLRRNSSSYWLRALSCVGNTLSCGGKYLPVIKIYLPMQESTLLWLNDNFLWKKEGFLCGNKLPVWECLSWRKCKLLCREPFIL